MRNVIVTGLLITLMQLACARQMKPGTPQERAAHKTEALTCRLNLTPEQATQVSAVFLRQALRIDSLKAQTQLHRRQTRRQITGSTDVQLSHILTPEQETTYTAWKLTKKEKHRNRHES